MKIINDNKKYFEAFEAFVKSFVDSSYKTDDDLLDDFELQGLASKLTNPDKANLNEFGFLQPFFFQMKDKLVHFLARFLYAQGFLHHVMNHKLLTAGLTVHVL